MIVGKRPQEGNHMKSRIELSVSQRESGKHFSRLNRTQGSIPAVIYGPKTKPVNVKIVENSVSKYLGRKFESTIFNLSSTDLGLNKVAVLLKDVQVHPVTRRPVHIDFFALDMDSNIRVSIGVKFEGKPAGLSDGGVLELIVREVEIECKPNEIPEELTIDVSSLGVGDALHVSDLKVPAGIKIISMPTLTLATVSIPKEVTAAPVAAAATDAAAATPAAGAAAGAAAPAADAKKEEKK